MNPSRSQTLKRSTLALVWMLAASSAGADGIATFDDLGLGAESEYHGEDSAGGFLTGGVHFNNNYDTTYQSWDGFAASTITDNTTPGFGNQYSAIPGEGEGGSAGYGVGYWSAYASESPTLFLGGDVEVAGTYITNSTYSFLSMRDGDPWAKQFGGATGDDEDWFLLEIDGYDAAGTHKGTVDFYLADFQFEDNSLDYLIDEWTFVDLTALGEVRRLEFSLSSSDNGPFGMNTPSYFGIDTVAFIPEPGAAGLVGAALVGVAMWRRRLR